MLKVGVLLLSIGLCFGLIDDLEIRNEGRHTFHLRSFGFLQGGHFEANLTDFRVPNTTGRTGSE